MASSLHLKNLFSNYLQLKSLFCMFWLSFSFWKLYKKGVFPEIFILKIMDIWDEPIKKTLPNKIWIFVYLCLIYLPSLGR
jgi:hypothetical protein